MLNLSEARVTNYDLAGDYASDSGDWEIPM